MLQNCCRQQLLALTHSLVAATAADDDVADWLIHTFTNYIKFTECKVQK